MKNYFLIFLILTSLSLNSFSQKNEEIKTIFGANDISNTGYLALTGKISQLNNQVAFFTGGKLAWTINKTFSIGFAGSGLTSENTYNYMSATDTLNSKFTMGYGGLMLEYIINPKDYIHFSTNLLLAYGSVELGDEYGNNFYIEKPPFYYSIENPQSTFLVIEPSGSVEFNITKNFRLGIEASYRFITNTNENDTYKRSTNLKDLNLNSFSAGLVFQFGWF